jgi:anti-sigma factor RsiW
MTVNDNNPIAPGEHVTEMLTEYIDRTLEPAERGRVRAHLEGCDTCQAGYAELLATRQMLRAVPAIQSPRSFTLTPEMARKVRPPSLFERIFRPSNAPGMALGSVLSFVLLFFVLVFGMARPLSNNPAPVPLASTQQEDARTMGAPAQSGFVAAEPTATTGAVAFSTPDIQALAPQATPEPATGQQPPNSGGAVPAAVPTEPVRTTAGDTDTSAGAESATTMAGGAAGTMKELVPSEANRQAAPPPYAAPVDWGAALMSIAPLFLLALGLALAVMAWVARSNRPA